MSADKKTIRFVVQCKASQLFISNFTLCRASVELTPVQALAIPFDAITDARRTADSLRPLFGSFDFQPVRVGG